MVSRPKPHIYRPIFEDANGHGPWPCYGCREPVESDELLIHHLDEDPWNNNPENLVAMHRPCHFSLHKKGIPHSDEHRLHISLARRGHPVTPETRAKISASSLGKTKVYSKNYRCAQCDVVSTLRGIQLHQRRIDGHKGMIPT